MGSKAFRWTGLSPFNCRLVVNVKPVDAKTLRMEIVHPNSGEVLHAKDLEKKSLSKEKVSDIEYFSLALALGNQIASTMNVKTDEQKPTSVYGKKRVKKNENA